MGILLIVLVNVLLLVSGQLFWKVALNRHPLRSAPDIVSVLMQPPMLLGCVLFAVATIVWFYALSRYDLSRVYPLQSLAYVMGAIVGMIFFKETISAWQWLGMLFIIGGAVLVAKP